MKIPAVIESYFAADNQDQSHSLSALFAADAVVSDEKTRHEGIDAIIAWSAAAKNRYGHTSEPLDAEEANGGYIVRARVTGRFPGSPILLTYRFHLEAEKIARLEIG